MKNFFLLILSLVIFSCIQPQKFDQYNNNTKEIKNLENFDQISFAKKVENIHFEKIKNPIIKKSQNKIFSLISEKKDDVYNLKRTIIKINNTFKIRYILKNISPKSYIVRWIISPEYESLLHQGEKSKEFRLQSNQSQKWNIIINKNPYKFEQK